MSFASYTFLLLVALALPLHWLLRGQTARLWVLLGASAAFYGFRHPPSLLLLAGTILLNHQAGLWQARAREQGQGERARRRLLAAIVAADLLPLAVFKYGAFLWSGVAALLSLGGAHLAAAAPLALPLGISFFTFQVIAYQVDVFRGQVAPERSLLRFAVFKSFFAQLVAGPIVRARELLPQLQGRRPFDAAGFHQGLFCVAAGLCLKLGVADVLRQFADEAFSLAAHGPAQLTTTGAFAGLLAYSAQLFADFWGYSTMAVGLGLLFGLELPINFHAPYLSPTLQEFWRRWHVTLSIWFRDYLYLPLGGSRSGSTSRNLVLTMGLAGLWHGAGVRFLAWGLLHGVWLAAERAVARVFPGRPRLPRPLAALLVFLGVTLLWVPFRAPGAEVALAYAARLFLPPYTASPVPAVLWGLWLAFALLHAPLTRLLDGRRFVALPVRAQASLTVALVLWALALAGAQVDFVYFAF
jgi:D-alanyl-lipoteichoic acid acyltransferase DltB (MBOAT superfamily)